MIPDFTNEATIYSELTKKLKKNKGKTETIESHKNLKDTYSKALQLMEQEDYIKALQEFQKIIQKAWGDISIWYSIILCKIKIEDYKGALNIIPQAIAKSGIDIKYWVLKGFLEDKMGYKYEALNTFINILSIYPSSTESILKAISILKEIGCERKAGILAAMMLPFFDRMSMERKEEIFTVSILNLATGRNDSAQKALNSFLELNNPSKDIELLSIYIDIAENNFDSALTKINEFKPDSENTDDYSLNLSYLLKAYIYVSMKKIDKAIEFYNKISTKFSSYSIAMYYKIIAFVQAHDQEIDANSIISNYVSENPNNYSLWEARAYVLSQEKKSYKEAVWAYSKALEIIPIAITPLLNSGLLMNRLGNYEEAIKYFDKVLSLEPDNKLAILYKAISLMYIEKYEEAEAFSEKLKCINLRNEYIYLIKAIILKKQDKTDECINEIEKAFAINPSNPEIWNLRGLLMRKTNKLNDEIFSYNKAMELDNNCVSACINKAIWFMEMKKYEEAKVLFDKVLSKTTENPIVWRESARCQYNLGNYRDAIRCYEISLQQNPNDIEAYNGKAATLMAMEKYSEALTAVNRSLEKNEKQPNILNNIGVILYKLSRPEEAYNAFVKASNQNEIYQETIYNLLLIATELNKTEKIEIYKKRYMELCSSEAFPKVGESQYMEVAYTKNITPFAYVDLASHFDLKIKNFPYLFLKTEKYLNSLKNNN